MKRLIAISMALVLATLASAQDGAVKVYVFARKGTDGFSDSTRLEDSVNDLREAIGKHKTMTWTFTESAADVSLEVVDSGRAKVGTESDTTVGRGILGGLHSNTTVQDKTLPSMTAIIHVRGSEYTKELSITRQMFWKDLARNIANQLDDWIKVNRSKLNQVRQQQ